MDNNESYTIFYEFYIENSSVNLSNLMEVSQITRKTPLFTFFLSIFFWSTIFLSILIETTRHVERRLRFFLFKQ